MIEIYAKMGESSLDTENNMYIVLNKDSRRDLEEIVKELRLFKDQQVTVNIRLHIPHSKKQSVRAVIKDSRFKPSPVQEAFEVSTEQLEEAGGNPE